MAQYSTQQVAKKLGIGIATLTRHIHAGKVPAPKTILAGAIRIRLWTDEEIECVRALLPKIANGRKTRHQKQRKKQTTRKLKR